LVLKLTIYKNKNKNKMYKARVLPLKVKVEKGNSMGITFIP
jgi:hypothetical protein